MLNQIRNKVGQNEDLYLAAAIIAASLEDEAEELVGLELVTRAQYNSLRKYRNDCCIRAEGVAVPKSPLQMDAPHICI
jgi:hypothetical protein